MKHCKGCFHNDCDKGYYGNESCADDPCYMAIRQDRGRDDNEFPPVIWLFHIRSCPLGDSHIRAIGG